MVKNFKVVSISEKGGRDENQDAIEYFTDEENDLVCVIADGLGGHKGGRVASHLAVRTVIQQAQNGFSFSQEGIRKLVQTAQREIVARQEKDKNLESMRTTIVVLAIHQNKALWIHSGDSRLYHFRNGSILSYTKDHSVPMMLVAAEEIKLDDVRHHKDRNKVYQSLGGKTNELKPTVVKKMIDIQKNDVFLLCTDGFWEYVLEKEMQSLWKGDLKQWTQAMHKYLIKRAEPGHDNYTACAVQVMSDDSPRGASKLSSLLSLVRMQEGRKKFLIAKGALIGIVLITLIFSSVAFLSGTKDSDPTAVIPDASENSSIAEQPEEHAQELLDPTDTHADDNDAGPETELIDEVDNSVKAVGEQKAEMTQNDTHDQIQAEDDLKNKIMPDEVDEYSKRAEQGDVETQVEKEANSDE